MRWKKVVQDGKEMWMGDFKCMMCGKQVLELREGAIGNVYCKNCLEENGLKPI